MKFFTRLSPLATSILALSMAVYLAFWGLSAPIASAGDGFWQPTSSEVCDYLELPGGPDYICADWIVQGGTEITCCIDGSILPGGTREACMSVIFPTTDDRPGL